MRTSELSCFGAAPGTGNPALVVEDGPPDPAARQALARERNITAVFIDRADGTQPVLDYWYPHARSPLCLHATLAAAHVLFAQQQMPAALPSSFPRTREPHFPGASLTLTVTTAMRAQPLVLSREGDEFYVELDVQPAPSLATLPDLAALLGRPGLQPASEPRVASVGSPKLLVEVADHATLYGLQPELAAIAAWGKANAVNGLYVWCRHPDGRYEGRNFNHRAPALEDAATGVAAGALTAVLGHGLTLLQGRATGHDCLIRTGVKGSTVLVGGAATPRQ
ncbi:MAG: PhzF family phenazine biosynthesis protein [Telluria sp.]